LLFAGDDLFLVSSREENSSITHIGN
jgi:hypothetical protein